MRRRFTGCCVGCCGGKTKQEININGNCSAQQTNGKSRMKHQIIIGVCFCAFVACLYTGIYAGALAFGTAVCIAAGEMDKRKDGAG